MNIIGLCGFAQTGKDTCALNMPGWTRFAFADALKMDIEYLPGINGFGGAENKEILRPLYVAYGAIARHFDPDVWIARLFYEIRRVDPEPEWVVVTDCRYKNEVAEILKRGGQVIRLDRTGVVAANCEEIRSFAEIEAEYPQMCRVLNDGRPEDMAAKVLEVTGWA